MNCKTFRRFDPTRVPSPCFVVDEIALENNLKILDRVQQESGAKVLLALKAFSMFSLAPLICQYLSGTCASGLHEAKLAYEEFGGNGSVGNNRKEVHTFSVAYTEAELLEILTISNHVVFNSFAQWQRFQSHIKKAKQQRPELAFGLRINPMHSEGITPIYDPCAPCSRLGIPLTDLREPDSHSPEFTEAALEGISGLHFHTLCEQGFAPLSRTLDSIEEQLGHILHTMEWVNFGGGHHITHPDYDLPALIDRIQGFQKKYDLQVYLEPGEAIALRTGVLVSEVLDLTHNHMDLAILDISATCHMPDTLEMPYRAEIFNAGNVQEKPFQYRLGGPSCLAGDVMGDYSFDQALQIGQRLIFDDMAHYTMVKTNTFNGIGLPSIAVWNSTTDQLRIVREFGFDDFKMRLS